MPDATQPLVRCDHDTALTCRPRLGASCPDAGRSRFCHAWLVCGLSVSRWQEGRWGVLPAWLVSGLSVHAGRRGRSRFCQRDSCVGCRLTLAGGGWGERTTPLPLVLRFRHVRGWGGGHVVVDEHERWLTLLAAGGPAAAELAAAATAAGEAIDELCSRLRALEYPAVIHERPSEDEVDRGVRGLDAFGGRRSGGVRSVVARRGAGSASPTSMPTLTWTSGSGTSAKPRWPASAATPLVFETPAYPGWLDYMLDELVELSRGGRGARRGDVARRSSQGQRQRRRTVRADADRARPAGEGGPLARTPARCASRRRVSTSSAISESLSSTVVGSRGFGASRPSTRRGSRLTTGLPVF